jgi:hypothetical protein
MRVCINVTGKAWIGIDGGTEKDTRRKMSMSIKGRYKKVYS